jgi:putative ubiquitin-RnfH superfamily antitoxin RatB of RatAB toxin-antitoxin module
MANSFEVLKVVLKKHGCSNPNSINYLEGVEVDDGSCIDESFTSCIQDAVLNSTLLGCEKDDTDKGVDIYTVYKSLLASLKENNQVKIEIYKEKLADLCNCKTC